MDMVTELANQASTLLKEKATAQHPDSTNSGSQWAPDAAAEDQEQELVHHGQALEQRAAPAQRRQSESEPNRQPQLKRKSAHAAGRRQASARRRKTPAQPAASERMANAENEVRAGDGQPLQTVPPSQPPVPAAEGVRAHKEQINAAESGHSLPKFRQPFKVPRRIPSSDPSQPLQQVQQQPAHGRSAPYQLNNGNNLPD